MSELEYSGRIPEESFFEGMAEAHTVVSDALESVSKSLGDVWSIYSQGILTAEKKAQVQELEFAMNTLTHLEQVFQDKYFSVLDKYKGIREREEALYLSAEINDEPEPVKIVLSAKEWRALEEALAEPNAPSQKLVELLKLTRKNQE